MNHLEFILKATKHPEHLVRSEAARLLGEIGDKKALPYLISMLQKDRWYSKVTAIYALAQLKDKKAVPVLRRLAQDPLVFDFNGFYNHDMLRIAAAVALLRLGDEAALENISELMTINESQGFLELSEYILELPSSAATRPLKVIISLDFLKNFSKIFQSGLQMRVLDALPYFKTAKSGSLIKKYLKHRSRYVRAKAAAALLKYKDSPENRRILKAMFNKEKTAFTKIKLAVLLKPAGTGLLLKKALKDGSYFTRATALDAAAELKLVELAGAVLPLLADEHPYVRICAIEALEKLNCGRAGIKIKKMLKDEVPGVRLQAAKYFLKLQK